MQPLHADAQALADCRWMRAGRCWSLAWHCRCASATRHAADSAAVRTWRSCCMTSRSAASTTTPSARPSTSTSGSPCSASTAAFSLAVAVGIPLGLLIGRIQACPQDARPDAASCGPVPVTAWLPLSMIFFGLGPNAAIFLVFLGAFFPIVLNTTFGVRSVDSTLFEAASMLGCTGSSLFRQVVLPAAMPSHFQRPAPRPRFRLDPDRGGRDDRRAAGPGGGDHGRPHAVAHRPRDLRHDRDRRRRVSSPTG